MSTVSDSGSVTTDGTEQAMFSTLNTAGSYVLLIDRNAMAAGDAMEIKIKRKVRGADTVRVYIHAPYAMPAVEPVIASIPFAVHSACDAGATIKRLAGTDRAYPWTLEKL